MLEQPIPQTEEPAQTQPAKTLTIRLPKFDVQTVVFSAHRRGDCAANRAALQSEGRDQGRDGKIRDRSGRRANDRRFGQLQLRPAANGGRVLTMNFIDGRFDKSNLL